ncbi:hypothetical protein RB601_009091 [Gaeumannomyces tritici]
MLANPSLANSGCVFVLGNSYCIEQNFGFPPPVTTTAGPTSAGNGVSTPALTQSGMVGNCNRFHLVRAATAAAPSSPRIAFLITHSYSLGTWLSITTCQFLIPGHHTCVGAVGSQTTRPPTTTT